MTHNKEEGGGLVEIGDGRPREVWGHIGGASVTLRAERGGL